jgi:hypothetical protein
VFEHDDARMTRGEPCTTVYHFDPATKARGDVIVEFMCLPRERPVASKFEAICSLAAIGGRTDLLNISSRAIVRRMGFHCRSSS